MKRRQFLGNSAALGLAAALSSCMAGKLARQPDSAAASSAVVNPLTPPAKGQIPVAFVISDGTVMIDLAGPWEVFADVMVPSRGSKMEDQMPFRLYTVAETTKPVRLSGGGLKIEPEYTFAKAPSPKVVVIPAQKGQSPAMLDWIRAATQATDVTMSVCTGAYILAATGLLSGKEATTHHDQYKSFAMQYPDINLKRGARFVEAGHLATSGGLSSGIDLALRVVERYFGREVATATATELEYQGQGWLNPGVNAVYLQPAVASQDHPLCPICGMQVDRSTAPKSEFHGKTYYFCSPGHQAQFEAAPDKWI